MWNTSCEAKAKKKNWMFNCIRNKDKTTHKIALVYLYKLSPTQFYIWKKNHISDGFTEQSKKKDKVLICEREWTAGRKCWPLQETLDHYDVVYNGEFHAIIQ